MLDPDGQHAFEHGQRAVGIGGRIAADDRQARDFRRDADVAAAVALQLARHLGQRRVLGDPDTPRPSLARRIGRPRGRERVAREARLPAGLG
ncbi:hypothetical protein AD428_08445 [Achromobacter sp. DMS1]|nr:hypothetical protein AD428_08445 [Achromobacter sp. DMS1]